MDTSFALQIANTIYAYPVYSAIAAFAGIAVIMYVNLKKQ
jgi:hypothetical protein